MSDVQHLTGEQPVELQLGESVKRAAGRLALHMMPPLGEDEMYGYAQKYAESYDLTVVAGDSRFQCFPAEIITNASATRRMMYFDRALFKKVANNLEPEVGPEEVTSFYTEAAIIADLFMGKLNGASTEKKMTICNYLEDLQPLVGDKEIARPGVMDVSPDFNMNEKLRLKQILFHSDISKVCNINKLRFVIGAFFAFSEVEPSVQRAIQQRYVNDLKGFEPIAKIGANDFESMDKDERYAKRLSALKVAGAFPMQPDELIDITTLVA